MKVVVLSLVSAVAAASGDVDESGMLQAKKISNKAGRTKDGPDFKWDKICDTWYKGKEGSFLKDSLELSKESFDKTNTLATCQDWCINEPGCNVVSFVPDGQHRNKAAEKNKGRCVLYSDDISKLPNDAKCTKSGQAADTYHLSLWAKLCDSWYKEGNTLYDSWDTHVKTLMTWGLEDCQNVCKETIGCNLIIHVNGTKSGHKTNRCVLRSVDTTNGPPTAECNNVYSGTTYYTHSHVMKPLPQPPQETGCEAWTGRWDSDCGGGYSLDLKETGCNVHAYSNDAWWAPRWPAVPAGGSYHIKDKSTVEYTHHFQKEVNGNRFVVPIAFTGSLNDNGDEILWNWQVPGRDPSSCTWKKQ